MRGAGGRTRGLTTRMNGGKGALFLLQDEYQGADCGIIGEENEFMEQ